jgi:hypothetical protein
MCNTNLSLPSLVAFFCCLRVSGFKCNQSLQERVVEIKDDDALSSQSFDALVLGSGIFEDRQPDPARAPGITTQMEK